MHHAMVSFFRLVRHRRAVGLAVVVSVLASGCTAFQLPEILKPTLRCERAGSCKQDVQVSFDAASRVCKLAIGTRVTRVPGGVVAEWNLVGTGAAMAEFNPPSGGGRPDPSGIAITFPRTDDRRDFIRPELGRTPSTFLWTANPAFTSGTELPYQVNVFVRYQNQSITCTLDPVIVNEL